MGQNNRSVKTLTRETRGVHLHGVNGTTLLELHPLRFHQKWFQKWGSPSTVDQEIEEIRSELKTAKKDMELRQNEFFGLDGAAGEREARKQSKI